MDGAIQYYELCHAHYTNWGLIITTKSLPCEKPTIYRVIGHFQDSII